MSASWTQSALADHLGDTFTAQTVNGERSIKLAEVDALPAQDTGNEAIRSDPFALVFRVAEGEALEQGTYRVEHAKLDPIDLFLVPVGAGQNEAIFN